MLQIKPEDIARLVEVSCIQYRPEVNRSKDRAERKALLDVRKRLQKRGFDACIGQFALAHRNSGHIHLIVAAYFDGDERLVCRCCEEAQRPIRTKSGPLRYKTCNCGDCVFCDRNIRVDLEQATRYDS